MRSRLTLVAVIVALTAVISSCGDVAGEPRLEPTTTTTVADTSDSGEGDDTSTDAVTEPDAESSSSTTTEATQTATTEATDDTTTTVPAPTTSRERLDPDDPNYPTLPPSPTVTYPETGGDT